MELLVRKLWFPYSAEEVAASLLRIPQAKKIFDRVSYGKDMRPTGLGIKYGIWPAAEVLHSIEPPKDTVCLILTKRSLRGDYGAINGRGENRVAIASACGYIGGILPEEIFSTSDVGFNAMAFGEIGHSLGLKHHAIDLQNQCEMTHHLIPGPVWKSLDEICFCKDCFEKIKK